MPNVASRQRSAPRQGYAGDLRVAQAGRTSVALPLRRQGGGFARRVLIERKNPVLKILPAPSGQKQLNTEAKRVEAESSAAQPSNAGLFGGARAPRLAEERADRSAPATMAKRQYFCRREYAILRATIPSPFKPPRVLAPRSRE